MVVAENSQPDEEAFEELLNETIDEMSRDVHLSYERQEYYLGRTAQKLEDDVVTFMKKCSQGGPFEGTISKESGQKFPDIIANGYYGVEVKTSTSDNWKSTGNSVLETTRIDDIEKIYLLFGKLVDPVEFRVKKYEECLSDVAVTHAPRYLINMELEPGNTIFDKIGLKYDEIRLHDNPAKPLLKNYRERLGDNADSWWLEIGEDEEPEEPVSPLRISHWRNVSDEEKKKLVAKAFILFPQILGSNQLKFTDLAIWLMKNHSIVNPSLRDDFTSGGTEHINVNGQQHKVPRMIFTLYNSLPKIIEVFDQIEITQLEKHWDIEIEGDININDWIWLADDYAVNVVNKYSKKLKVQDLVNEYL